MVLSPEWRPGALGVFDPLWHFSCAICFVGKDPGQQPTSHKIAPRSHCDTRVELATVSGENRALLRSMRVAESLLGASKLRKRCIVNRFMI